MEWFFNGTNRYYTQFIRYIHNSSNLDELEFIFNAAKADETTVKNAFKNLFSIEIKKNELFNAMTPQLKLNLFNTTNEILQKSYFDSFINDINSDLYKFIKSE